MMRTIMGATASDTCVRLGCRPLILKDEATWISFVKVSFFATHELLTVSIYVRSLPYVRQLDLSKVLHAVSLR